MTTLTTSISAATLLTIIFAGCASNYGEKAIGHDSVWCNHRYLTTLDRPFDKIHLDVAERGYLYALIAAYVLQVEDKEGSDHQFALPKRIKEVDALRPKKTTSGFEGRTFEVFVPSEDTLENVVIAFTGSNDAADWKTNFSSDKKQYIEAEQYVNYVDSWYRKKYESNPSTYPSYKDLTYVVTGYSLGGGLAVHVTKVSATSSKIKMAWIFNPSPKTWSNSGDECRIWQASTKGDVLRVARSPFFRIFPGVYRIGAPDCQRAENFYLIESNRVYAHFRWALARNMLHVADLALVTKNPTLSERDSEPMQILRMSTFSACPEP